MRNFCKIFVVLLLILASFGNVLYADDELYTEGNLQYTINNDSRIEVAYYYGKETTFTIPWNIGVYQIEDFKDGAFNNSDVTTIKAPDYLYDYSTGTSKINARSYNPGTIIIFYDAFGNEAVTVDTSIKNEIKDPMDDRVHEEDPIIKTLDDDIESAFEDQEISVFDDDGTGTQSDENQGGFLNQVAKRIRDAFLFNGAQFASNFASNPIGYILIFLSIAGLIYLFVRYIRRR